MAGIFDYPALEVRHWWNAALKTCGVTPPVEQPVTIPVDEWHLRRKLHSLLRKVQRSLEALSVPLVQDRGLIKAHLSA